VHRSSSFLCTIYPSHPVLLNFIILINLDEDCKLWNCVLCNFVYAPVVTTYLWSCMRCCDIFDRYIWETQTFVLIPYDNKTGTEPPTYNTGGARLLHQGEHHCPQIWKSVASQMDKFTRKLKGLFDFMLTEHEDSTPLIPKPDILHDPEPISSISHCSTKFP
jgi:hypothetical protein